MGGSRPKTDSSARIWSASRASVLFLIAFTALAGAGCSHTSSTDSDPASATPGSAAEEAPQRTNMVEACSRFTALALASDTEIDHGPADARRRAALQFGTAELTRTIAGEGRDQTWPTLAEHKARVQVDVEPIEDDPPPLRPDRGGAGIRAQLTAIGVDGWRQPLPGMAVYCSLVSSGDDWKVEAVTFSDVDQSGAPG